MTTTTADAAALARADRPADKPARPYFSSGPCAKPPGWAPERLALGSLGRSHRSKLGKSRLQYAIDLTREILRVPETHRIGIVPASDTGAYEMAMWSMLGARPVTALAWESFGEGWVTDAVKQLKLDPTVMTAPYGALPDLGAVDFSHDVLFTWNGTTSGVRVPGGDWIPADRQGLTFADATSAVFAVDMPWDKIDVLTYSWQKVLGGEGAHGVLILGPRAVERLESYTPAWPLPKIFRMTKGGKLIEGIFQGETINTPSMLAVEDYIFALEWAKEAGGLDALIARSDANAAALDAIVAARPWLGHLAADPATRSTTSVCLTLADPAVAALDEAGQLAIVKKLASLLEVEDVAYDIAGYRDAPPGLRIWCGATVDASDIAALGPWLDWAWAQVRPSA
jgi:phosphoserine aminotransferase